MDERLTPDSSDSNDAKIKEEDVISQGKLSEGLNLDGSSSSQSE